MKCSEAKLTLGIWNLPLSDLLGNPFTIPFYIVDGNGYLLVGNDVLRDACLLNDKHLIIISPEKTSPKREDPVYLSSYHSSDNRTHLFVVPAQKSSMGTFLASARSLYAMPDIPLDSSRFSEGRYCKWFAFKLHSFTHYQLPDMLYLCRKANILTPALRQALQIALKKCTSCKTTGRPLNSKKVSFDKILREFNEHVQIDFLFIEELGSGPILHARDKATGYSETVRLSSRDLDDAAAAFSRIWIDSHGPPKIVSADREFFKSSFRTFLKDHLITLEERPARRHNKLGIVESRHRSLRLFVQRLLKDAEYWRLSKGLEVSRHAVLSRATFLCNALRGNAVLSSFELARGYLPSFVGLPQTLISKGIFEAYKEQQAKRAISRMLRSKTQQVVKAEILKPKTPVYYFVKGTKRGEWKLGFVSKSQDHSVEVTANSTGRGHKIAVAYEDIRLVPSSALLYELQQIELDLLKELSSKNPRAMDVEVSPEKDSSQDLSKTSSQSEESLWSYNPLSRSLLAQNKKEKFNEPAFDIGSATEKENPQRDIGEYQFRMPTEFPLPLESCEQDILKQIRNVIGDKAVSESKLQFAPRWIIDKAIENEKNNYKSSIEPVCRFNLPGNANVVSSHHFFVVKFDGESGKLKLRCRVVPHGNRDQLKDDLRSDSSTAQFPIIRTVLSMAVIHKFTLATLDISKAYLQAGDLQRDIYMRPPTGWEASRGEVWKLLKPAYGLVESGRLWQTTVEPWMNTYGLQEIPGMPQLFVLQGEDPTPRLILAKVVDDFLLAGNKAEIQKFRDAISKRFKVGQFSDKGTLVFNRLHIKQHENWDIELSMEEYMDTIHPLNLPKDRRKQSNDTATNEEITNFLGLTGKTNFLGHGCLPMASFVASHLQQLTSALKVEDLKTANKAFNEIRNLSPKLLYKAIPENHSAHYVAFSDAAQGKQSYGQTGYISGILFQTPTDLIFHVIDWHSSKQSRVSFSSVGAEILAAAAAADRSSLMTEGIRAIHSAQNPLPLVLNVDSLGLHATISTVHEGRDYRLRPTVSRLRDSFESGEIAVLQWIEGQKNIADALTKRNVAMYRKVNHICTSGKIDPEIFKKSVRVLSNH